MIENKRCLVTGGAGFIGSHLVDELIKSNNKVIIIDNLSTGKNSNINPKAEFHNLDITNYDAISPLFQNTDYVFHLAAQARIQPSIKDPRETINTNVIGTTNVLLASREAKVKKVVYSASSSAYGEQDNLPLKEDMKTKLQTPQVILGALRENGRVSTCAAGG